MILSLLIGSVLSLIGKLGEDLVSVISYVVSKENFNNKNNPILLGKSDKLTNYFKIIFHGNGSLEDELDLKDIYDFIDELVEKSNFLTKNYKKIRLKIKGVEDYKKMIEFFNDRVNFLRSDFGFITPNEESYIDLGKILKLFNREISNFGEKEKWDIEGDKKKSCFSGIDNLSKGENIFHPLTCKPSNRDWINDSSTSLKIKEYSTIIFTIIDLVINLNYTDSKDSFKKMLDELDDTYFFFITSIGDIIFDIDNTIGKDLRKIKEKKEDGLIFNFLNLKFIRTNLKIILKYIKLSFGKYLFNLGICFVIIGFSLIISISSMILLININKIPVNNNYIINNNFQKNKKVSSCSEIKRIKAFI
jgi:hypothetical protein